MTNYINEDHTQCNEEQTKKLVEKLQSLGWDIEYGISTVWEFASDWERDDFETAFSSVFNEVVS